MWNGLFHFLGNNIIGRKNVPPALIHIIQVIVGPRSADLIVPINFAHKYL